MPMAHAISTLPCSSSSSSCCICPASVHSSSFRRKDEKAIVFFCFCGETTPRRRVLAVSRWKLGTAGTTSSKFDTVGNVQSSRSSSSVEIPVTCYQLVGVPDQAEKDEIVKSVMELKSSEIEEGYTMDAALSRQELLMDVRDKLLFEPEYAGNMKEKIPPKSSLRIPWAWLSGALCILQEVGEEKLVLDIGRAAFLHPDAKPYVQDLLLSMALAECTIAKVGFEKNKVSEGFEALARAQCLLKSKPSLGKMPLLSQIEESLEELAPACTLELLGMPHSPENTERRRGAIAALRELLRQGLDVESSCRVQDWPCFLGQALDRLMATEIVDLLPWDNLAITRKNKKSIESQNQRVVVDFSCFYLALIAHVALGFSSKQVDLINKARTMCECLITSDSVDLKFEEAFCLFLLGQGSEAEAVERLQHLEINATSRSRNSTPGKEITDTAHAKPSLEMWLKDAVLAVFPDTRDCSASLVYFFSKEKKSPGNRQSVGASQSRPSVTHRQLSDFQEPLLRSNASRHLGSAVKQLAPADLQSPFISGKNSCADNINSSVQLKRNLSLHHNQVSEKWMVVRNVVGRIIFVTVLGSIIFTTFKLSNMKPGRMRIASGSNKMDTSSLPWTAESSLNDNVGPLFIKGSGITGRLRNLLQMVKIPFRIQPITGNLHSSYLATNLSPSVTAVYRKPMPMEEAEALVKQWQAIKAEALGPSHQVHSLFEVLDESMLVQWQGLADAAKARSCFWRFVLLQLSILRADILLDGTGLEILEVEAFLEEAAELVDSSQPKNPNYYSTYNIRYVLKRQDDGSWRFCEGNIQIPS